MEQTLRLKNLRLLESRKALDSLPKGKLLINTINAHSYNVALKDKDFARALLQGDVLLPDGAGVVLACKWLRSVSKPINRIAGWDLFVHHMAQLKETGGTAFFLGASQETLRLVAEQCAKEYPGVRVATFSPTFKDEFSAEDSQAMVDAINEANPDVVWIGMTAPKQEKWAYAHFHEMKINCHVCCIGAVFGFFSKTRKRAPKIMQRYGLEWLFRLLVEPRRLWKRYLIGNFLFLYNLLTKEWMAKVA